MFQYPAFLSLSLEPPCVPFPHPFSPSFDWFDAHRHTLALTLALAVCSFLHLATNDRPACFDPLLDKLHHVCSSSLLFFRTRGGGSSFEGTIFSSDEETRLVLLSLKRTGRFSRSLTPFSPPPRALQCRCCTRRCCRRDSSTSLSPRQAGVGPLTRDSFRQTESTKGCPALRRSVRQMSNAHRYSRRESRRERPPSLAARLADSRRNPRQLLRSL